VVAQVRVLLLDPNLGPETTQVSPKDGRTWGTRSKGNVTARLKACPFKESED